MITPAIATCESILAKLGLGKDFKDVEVRDHACGDINVIKKLYYSGPNCAVDQSFTSEDHCPQCKACSSREPVKKKVAFILRAMK